MKKKKAFMFLVMALLAVSTAACGGTPSSAVAAETTNTPEEPLDLTGLWIQDDHSGDTYMVADVREDGKIGVFFYVKNDTPWTYWVGTYEAPETNGTKYSWTSASTYSGSGLLASSDSSKTFTYEDDVLKFPMTIQGQTGEAHLVRGEWDVSKVPENAYAEKVSDDAKEAALSGECLEITDSDWYMNNKWLMYYVKLRNTSTDTVIEYPSYRITARDKDGIPLGSEEQVLSVIYPGQEFVFGSQAFSVEEAPETVEFEVLPPSDYNLTNASTAKAYKPLTIINDKIRSERYVGEVSNPNDYAIDSVRVMITGWDSEGNLIEIEGGFVNDLPANGTVPFDISLRTDQEIAKYEAFANQW